MKALKNQLVLAAFALAIMVPSIFLITKAQTISYDLLLTANRGSGNTVVLPVGETVLLTATMRDSNMLPDLQGFKEDHLRCNTVFSAESYSWNCVGIVGDTGLESNVFYIPRYHPDIRSNSINIQVISGCNPPKVRYRGKCEDPLPTCIDPPQNSTSCVDKIENDTYIKNYNFYCLSGFTKSGNTCVRDAASKAKIKTYSINAGSATFYLEEMPNKYDHEYYFVECFSASGESYKNKSNYSSVPVLSVDGLWDSTDYNCQPALATLYASGSVSGTGSFGDLIPIRTSNFYSELSPIDKGLEDYYKNPLIIEWVPDVYKVTAKITGSLKTGDNYYVTCYKNSPEGDPVSHSSMNPVIVLEGFQSDASLSCNGQVRHRNFEGNYSSYALSESIGVRTLSLSKVGPGSQPDFNISITSDPKSDGEILRVKRGDVLHFEGVEVNDFNFEPSPMVWSWNKKMLSCVSPIENKLNCTVTWEGEAEITAQSYIQMGEQSKIYANSNKILVTTEKPPLISNFGLSTYENNVGLFWDPVSDSDLDGRDAFAVYIKEDKDFTSFDLATKVEPVYVPVTKKTYTFSNLIDGTYYFKMGIGKYEEDKWSELGDFTDSLKKVIIGYPEDEVKDAKPGIPTAGFEEAVVTTAHDTNPFPDVDSSSLEGRSASDLYRRGVIGGFPDGEFKGGNPVNRAEAAKFLLLAADITVQELKNNDRFWDVLEGQWYVKYVMTAASKGIIGGYSDGSYRPGNQVNTAEFLKMLSIAFDLPEGLSYSYEDVPDSAWYAKYAGIAEKYDLWPERTTKLYPADQLSRKDVAVAIYQYLENR